jgi:hypothetical protein
MKFLEILNKYYDEGWLIKQSHPYKDLTIWNYSRQTQWEDHWDEITLMCRGLVTNSKGDIVSRCFNKFFNWEQLLNVNYPIPDEPFELFEKMDGQLGLLFWYEDEWIFASRGSFTSMYAERAKQLLKAFEYQKFAKDYTYIFEIIFKEGRIVCKYDFEGLVLLGRIEIVSGIELPVHNVGFEDLGCTVVKKYDGVTDFETIKSSIKPDAEGYVIRFKSGFRMKIKGEEYCRLHSIITKISSRDIWTYLKDGLPMNELLEHVPDEFDQWVHEQIDIMRKSYKLIDTKVRNIFVSEINTGEFKTRKDLALKILTYDKSLHGMFFNMCDGKDYSHMIWAKLYPKYSRPFTINDDEGDDN